MGTLFSKALNMRLLVKSPKGTDLAKAALEQKPAYVADEQLLCRMVNAISDLAILSSDVIHIETAYSANTKDFQVKVFNADTNYFGMYKPIFDRAVYLDNSLAYEQLRDLEDKLIELIADAKDKAMGAV